MNKRASAQLASALETRSLLSEGWLYVGRFEYGTQVVTSFRHPNGNRAKVKINDTSCELYINSKLVKVYE